MKANLLKLYRVSWKMGTAYSYVATKTSNVEDIKKIVREQDCRCDSIKSIERVFLPAFDGDNLRDVEFVSVFTDLCIM